MPSTSSLSRSTFTAKLSMVIVGAASRPALTSSALSDSAGGTLVDEEPTNQAWHVPATWVASAFGASGRDLKMLEISGDSMELVLHAGNLVLINLARRTPNTPGILVAHDGFGLVAKQLELTPNGDPPEILLTSANRRYPPHRRHIDEITIIGRVVWFGRRL